jgi:hypothetical protein
MARDCPLLRQPWCSHYRTNGHAIEDCQKLIAKWEDWVRQRGTNLISSEIKIFIRGQLPNLNIVTQGGEKTGIDTDNLPHIQKATPKEDMNDPPKHKLFFKNSIEVFHNISSPEMQEKPHQPIVYPKIAEVPASPPAPRNPVVPMRQPEQPQNVVDLWFQLFFDILWNDQLTEKFRNALHLVLGNEESLETRIRTNLPKKNTQRVQRRKVRTGKEFRLVAQLDEFNIKDVMLDLGSDVNILPKKTWEALGKPQLTNSPIQLRMANQYCIFPIGRLENVEIDVAGVKTVAYFEVIEIMGYKDPYPTLLGIDWDYDNYAMIDLKTNTMTFEADGIKVVQPLDPYVGRRYTEPTDNNMEGEDLD